MIWMMLIALVLGYGIMFFEYRQDKKRVEELGKERAELVDKLYRLCEIAEMQQELIRDLQKKILTIEQEIEELNDKWM